MTASPLDSCAEDRRRGGVLTGVYVLLDTSEAITRPATKDDKLKMLDEEK